MSSYLERIVNGALFHVRACKMHHSVNPILLLAQPSERETPFFRTSTGSPCDVDR